MGIHPVEDRVRQERHAEWLWQTYGPALRRYVDARLGADIRTRIAPDAVVNEVLLEWTLRQGALAPDTELDEEIELENSSPYQIRARLFVLARYRLLDAARRERRRRGLALDDVSEVELAGCPSASGVVARAELLSVLQEACARLPPHFREVVEARAFGGRSFVDLGHQFGISADGVRKRFRAALELLRADLERVAPADELLFLDAQPAPRTNPGNC